MCYISTKKLFRSYMPYPGQHVTWVLINENTLWKCLWHHSLNSLDVSRQETLINNIHEESSKLVCRDNKTAFEELLSKGNSVAVRLKNLQPLATEIFKVRKDIAPIILKEVFQFENPTRNLCSDVNTFLSQKTRATHHGRNYTFLQKYGTSTRKHGNFRLIKVF